MPKCEGRRFSRPETKFRVVVGAIWLGAVALVTVVALVTRPADAGVATKGAFYLVFLTIPGVLVATVLIRSHSLLITTAVLAGAWSMALSARTMRSPHHAAGFGILVTPMVAFVIVGIGCLIDLFARRDAAGGGTV